MKKILALLLLCSLSACLLTGCSKNEEAVETPETTADFAPDMTSVPYVIVEEELPAAVDTPLTTHVPENVEIQPTDAPVQTAHSYTLTALTDQSFGYVFAYPTGWKNLPGKYTICFREEVESGDFPARVAITKKSFAHTPKDSTVLSQFQSFAQTIYAQYDPDTFEFGTLNSNARFLGQKAHEITYLAYSGDIEVQGYMICCRVDHDIYVFHFCSSYDDYSTMETMMKQMRDTVTIIK